ncbi:ubiquitin C-terminal hydrolase Ubp14 [Kalmusia sp. IMI 367209]|nr:ubiquitin C-terminal hydrolase Ubp14 [Kalmusia sp. IMI 367209]
MARKVAKLGNKPQGQKRGREDGEGSGSEKPVKRKRQANSLGMVELYNNLAAESEEIRLEAAKQLILKISPESNPSAEDVHKALNRLIQGLCTHRKAARFGFCVTLTELLRQLFAPSSAPINGLDLDIHTLFKKVEKLTKVEGKASGQERRNHLIGKLFAYKAILQSSILVEPELAMSSWNELLDLIYAMARDIPWLREECALILVQTIETLTTEAKLEPFVRALSERLVSYKLANTPEGIAIWLALQTKHEAALPANVWHDNDPLSTKNRPKLSKVLKGDIQNAPDSGTSDAIKSAAANANPQFAWTVILSKVLQIDNEAKVPQADANKSQFGQLWLNIVDAQLLGSSSSHERKSWGFKLFAQMISHIPEWAFPALFSPNLMRTLLNQTTKEDRFLHLAALNVWKAISSRARQSPESSLALIVELTSKHGTADFKHSAKAEALEQISLAADDDSLRKIVRHLHSLLLRPESTEQNVADHRRQTVADLLLNIVKHYKRYDDLIPDFSEKDNWLRNVLDLFVEYAYFKPSSNAKSRKVPSPPISVSGREMFQERLSSCLTWLLRVAANSQTSFGVVVVDMIRSKAANRSFDLIFEADESVEETIEKAYNTFDTVKASRDTQGQASASQGFALLYAFTFIQIFNGDTDAVMMLHDLDSSYKALSETAKSSRNEGQDGFIEILLSFLGNTRTLFHKIAIEAFTAFAPEISLEGLRSMIDILDTEESLEGQKQLFAQDNEEADEAGSEEEDDDDDMEDASDVEMIDESESEGEEDEEVTRFNNMLALTLQTSKLAANGDGSESSDDSDMDDDQMMALDPHLSNIFKQRSQITGKKQRKDAKENVIRFKSRVLDLLAVFLDKQFSNPLTLEVLLPVLRLTRATANKQFTSRSSRLLQSTFDSHFKSNTPLPKLDDVEPALEILRGIHEEAKQGGSSTMHASACSAASLHIVKTLVNLDKDNYAKVVDVYAESQKEWFSDTKSEVRDGLFSQFLNWSSRSRLAAKAE